MFSQVFKGSDFSVSATRACEFVTVCIWADNTDERGHIDTQPWHPNQKFFHMGTFVSVLAMGWPSSLETDIFGMHACMREHRQFWHVFCVCTCVHMCMSVYRHFWHVCVCVCVCVCVYMCASVCKCSDKHACTCVPPEENLKCHSLEQFLPLGDLSLFQRSSIKLD